MKEFIYALENLFVNGQLLDELQACQYYIGAYQRGYKWKSFSQNDQVPLFLTDIYQAYLENASEYYLQYITIKKNDEQQDWLEVIDGQQRLTTISLLFYSFAKHFGFENITENKVIYERYLKRSIFDEVLIYDEADEGIKNILKKQQDIYYIYHAAACIKTFLLIDSVDAKGFYNYCRQNVKIIINLEDEMASAEEIFSNLNDNKVDLTNYYLIKGLLFTKSTRSQSQNRSFTEIQQQRDRIARNWDEIDNWLQDKVHNQLFFKEYTIVNKKDGNIGINSLLNALKPQKLKDNPIHLNVINSFIKELNSTDSTKYGDENALFNRYNDNLTNSDVAEQKLLDIHQTAKRLRNWYADNELHNLIGYYTCTGGKLDNILRLGLTELKKSLYNHLVSTLQIGGGREIRALNYSEDLTKLNTIFLALNVFGLKSLNDKVVIDYSYRFDFESYRDNKWSIEHIYPQSPDCTNDDYEEYYEWFLARVSTDEVDAVLKSKVEEKLPLSQEELTKIADRGFDEHQLGNLALLQSGNNSTLKNYIFPKKRKILLNLITQGAFVPQHTINAVAKLANDINGCNLGFTKNLTDWEEADINANTTWIANTYENLLTIVEVYEIGEV